MKSYFVFKDIAGLFNDNERVLMADLGNISIIEGDILAAKVVYKNYPRDGIEFHNVIADTTGYLPFSSMTGGDNSVQKFTTETDALLWAEVNFGGNKL